MVGLSDFSLNLIGSLLSLVHGAGFGIDADDGFGVRLAEMYPTIGEVKLHAVNISYLDAWFARILLLHASKNSIDISLRRKVNTLLGDLRGRIGLAKLADGERWFVCAQVSQVGKEKGYAYEGIASVVRFGINDTAITFATDDGIGLLHLGYDIHFTDSSCTVLAATGTGYIAQGTA